MGDKIEWHFVIDENPTDCERIYWGYNVHENQVEIVEFNGSWWQTVSGSDDINIVAWAEMTYPDVTEIHNRIDRGEI